MRNLKDAKDIYDHIVVPEELDERLRKALENVPDISSSARPDNLAVFCRRISTVAAALLLCFTIGLNTSQSFAMEMSQLPIIGTVARVLTIRSYKLKEDNRC